MEISKIRKDIPTRLFETEEYKGFTLKVYKDNGETVIKKDGQFLAVIESVDHAKAVLDQ